MNTRTANIDSSAALASVVVSLGGGRLGPTKSKAAKAKGFKKAKIAAWIWSMTATD